MYGDKVTEITISSNENKCEIQLGHWVQLYYWDTLYAIHELQFPH